MRQFTSSDAAALPFDTFLDVLPEDPSSDPAVVIRSLTDSAPPLTFQHDWSACPGDEVPLGK